jgi:hypothetical protein
MSPAISWREQVNFQWDDDEVRFVLDQHAELDFYIASSLKQQFADRRISCILMLGALTIHMIFFYHHM